eukprot:GGOE01037167.1.p1 GENE.GGOE01037167.1~~GGOE01037167.1.p1  ORF type:complete len:736 (-),score=181.52 GGOE01037167.1:337-2544(-)
MARFSDVPESNFEGEVISVVSIVTNFLTILQKAEEAHDLDEQLKVQKYKFLTNYFQRISPELSQQLTSLLSCVQELTSFVLVALSLDTVASWPVPDSAYQRAEDTMARIRRCQQTWQYILKQLTTLGTKYFPDDRRSKIETRTALVAVADSLSSVLKSRGDRGTLMCRMLIAQYGRNVAELARCCVAHEALHASQAVGNVYDRQLARCREMMHALEFFDQLRTELETSTSTLEDEASIRNQLAWSEAKMRQSGVLAVLRDTVEGEEPLLALFREPAQRELDRVEIRARSVEILLSALNSNDVKKLMDVTALAEAMGFGRGTPPAKAKEEWHLLTKCKELLAKLRAIDDLTTQMQEARVTGTRRTSGEAIRRANLFLASQGLATGEKDADGMLPHRNDDHWLPAHSEAYRQLCRSHRLPATNPKSRPAGKAVPVSIPSFTSRSRRRSKTPDCRPSRVADAAESSGSAEVRVKVHFEDEIRVFAASRTWALAELKEKLHRFLLPHEAVGAGRNVFRIRYLDEAGDLITIATEAELSECWQSIKPTRVGTVPKVEFHVDRRNASPQVSRRTPVSQHRSSSPTPEHVINGSAQLVHHSPSLILRPPDRDALPGVSATDSPPIRRLGQRPVDVKRRLLLCGECPAASTVTFGTRPSSPADDSPSTVILFHPYVGPDGVLDASPSAPHPPVGQPAADPRPSPRPHSSPNVLLRSPDHTTMHRISDRVVQSVPCWHSPHGTF